MIITVKRLDLLHALHYKDAFLSVSPDTLLLIDHLKHNSIVLTQLFLEITMYISPFSVVTALLGVASAWEGTCNATIKMAILINFNSYDLQRRDPM